MPSRKRGPAAAAAATSSDEDSFDETPARGGRGKAAASAKPPAKPASGATLTIWTKRQMKGKLEGEIRSEIQHGATWEAFKELRQCWTAGGRSTTTASSSGSGATSTAARKSLRCTSSRVR